MTDMPPEELERLVRETRTLAEDNNRLLRLMRRDALIGTILKVIIWLVVLGVPIFFLSSYLGPIRKSLSGNAETAHPGVFGLPSKEQVDGFIRAYQGE